MESTFETQVTLAPEQAAAAGTAGVIVSLIQLVFIVLMAVSMWKIFVKAGKPGWASIIPIYNIVVWLEIIGRPVWWILLMFIPLVNFIIAIILVVDFAKAFGKSVLFAIFGLLIFPFVGFPMLAFGEAKYVGPVAKK